MNCPSKPSPLRLLLALILPLVLAGNSSALLRYPTSDDFLSPPERSCSRPSPSPDGRQAAYVVRDEGLAQIWVRTLTRPPSDRLVSDGQSNDDTPDWSPDGSQIYFASDRGGASKIWVMNRDGSGRKQVTFGAGNDFNPRVSPSGRRIAYDSNRQGNYDVWIRDIQSGRSLQVTQSPSGDFGPAWSPAEDEIAFTSSREGRFDIWIKDATGRKAARRLTSGRGGSAHPDWSPDGRLLAFDSDREGKTKVYVQSTKGSTAPRAVTNLISVEEHPRFTTDGSRLYFTASENRIVGFKAKAVPQLETPQPEPLAAVRATRTRVGSPPDRDVSQPASRGRGGLKVLTFFPHSARGGVEIRSPIGAVLSSRLRDRQDLKSMVRLLEATRPMSIEVSYNPSLKRIEVLPDLPLRPNEVYRVELSTEIQGVDGTTLETPFSWRFRTDPPPPPMPSGVVMNVGQLTQDFIVSQRQPQERERGVAKDVKIHASFNFPLDPKSVDAGSLRLFADAGQAVPGELFFPPGDYALQLRPYQELRPGQVYKAVLSPGLKSRVGTNLTGSLDWRFKTAFTGDLKVLGVLPRSPLGERPRIVVRFNRPLSRRSLKPGGVVLQGPDFPYPGSTTLTPTGDLLTFEPYQRLPDNQSFTLFLPVDLVDTDGNPLELDSPIVLKTDHSAASRKRGTPAVDRAPEGGETAQRASSSAATAGVRGNEDSGPGLLGRYLTDGVSQASEAEGWMIQDLKQLSRQGHLSRDFGRDVEIQGGSLSRFRSALYVEEALRAFPHMGEPDRERVRRLSLELRQELAALGVRVSRSITSTPAGRARQSQPGPAGFTLGAG